MDKLTRDVRYAVKASVDYRPSDMLRVDIETGKVTYGDGAAKYLNWFKRRDG